MKTKENKLRNSLILMRNLLKLRQIQFIALAIVLFAAGSCKDDEPAPPDPNVIFLATLNGASESPVTASTATGTATLTFNTDTKIFSIVVNYTGVTATNSHIHKGAVGVPGGIVFGFTAPFTSPIYYTSPPLDATQEADLNANLYYVNIHSAAYPAGEIRGQLIKQ
jgi:hypothetical protein